MTFFFSIPTFLFFFFFFWSSFNGLWYNKISVGINEHIMRNADNCLINNYHWDEKMSFIEEIYTAFKVFLFAGDRIDIRERGSTDFLWHRYGYRRQSIFIHMYVIYMYIYIYAWIVFNMCRIDLNRWASEYLPNNTRFHISISFCYFFLLPFLYIRQRHWIIQI